MVSLRTSQLVLPVHLMNRVNRTTVRRCGGLGDRFSRQLFFFFFFFFFKFFFFYGLQDNNSFSALTGDRVEVLSSAIKLIDPCSSERSDASLEANMKLIIILESKGVGVCWLVGWFVCV